jgi:hypothetical protein
VNREANDVKLGLLELKEAYSLEGNHEIIEEMHAVKEGY